MKWGRHETGKLHACSTSLSTVETFKGRLSSSLLRQAAPHAAPCWAASWRCLPAELAPLLPRLRTAMLRLPLGKPQQR